MKLALLLVLFLALLVLFSVPAGHADSHSLVIINFTYQVDPGAQDYFQSVLSYAELLNGVFIKLDLRKTLIAKFLNDC